VHASFKAAGARHPESIIQGLAEAVGSSGTLLMPGLSYRQEPSDVHDSRHTPTCVGYLTEYFRTRAGTLRSLHPTHSVCATGAQAGELIGDHALDETPCGPHSPFRMLMDRGGKILML